MDTNTSFSLLEAAQKVGRSKPTILRAIQSGKISAAKNELTGEWRIEPAELFRVYEQASEEAGAPVQEEVSGTARTTSLDARSGQDLGGALRVARSVAELDALKRELEQEKDERARERRQMEETVSDLRRRLDTSDEERRQKDAQLTHLLTDQRERKEKAPPPSKGLLARLFGT